MIKHGRDGWTLEDYDWDERTGVAVLTYSRVRVDTGETQTKTITRAQPSTTHHVGWHIGQVRF